MYVVYIDMKDDRDAFYRQRPGHKPYFCFNLKFKGDTEAILHWMTYLVEVDKAVWPVRHLKTLNPIPMLAEVCPN